MQCTLRSWNRDKNNGSGLFSSGGTTSSRPNSQQPSPAESEVGSPAAPAAAAYRKGGENNGENIGAGIAAAWLAQQQQQQQQNGQGRGEQEKLGLASHDSSPAINKLFGQDNDDHHHGPEILFKAVHSNAGMVSRHSRSGNQSLSFSHIRSRSAGRATTPMKARGRLPSPLVGRPPVSTIDKKNMVAAADGEATGSNAGSRSSSRQRPASVGRSQSRGRRGLGSSALAAATVFDSQGLNDSGGGGDYSNGVTPGDSPYNSDGEGCSLNAIAALPSYRIPTSDIIVADISIEQDEPSSEGGGGGGIKYRIYLTTVSSGYFEIAFDSANSHSVMVTFLHAALPPERVHRKVDPVHSGTNGGPNVFSTASCCADTVTRESFDMDNFMAKELNETVQREGIFDKLKRRIAHIAGQCGDCEYCAHCFVPWYMYVLCTRQSIDCT